MDFQKLNGKQFRFCGEVWTLKTVPSMKSGTVGEVLFRIRTVRIVKGLGWFDTLMHELLEAATYLHKSAFINTQDRVLFSFDHDTLDNIARDVSGALAQILSVE